MELNNIFDELKEVKYFRNEKFENCEGKSQGVFSTQSSIYNGAI